MIVQDKTDSSINDPLWTVKINLRVLSISIDTLLLIIISVLAAGSTNDTAPVAIFGPVVSLQLSLILSFINRDILDYCCSDMELHRLCISLDQATSQLQSLYTHVL